jgi:hypothetical protein
MSDTWIVRYRFVDNYTPPSLTCEGVLTHAGPHAELVSGGRFDAEAHRLRNRAIHGLVSPEDFVTLEHNGVVVKTVRPETTP